MSHVNNNDNGDRNEPPKENIFQIMDGIIAQLNKTKKMFIIMILTIMIIPPIAFAVTFALLEPPFHFGHMGSHDSFGSPPPPPHVAVARIVPILISFVWLGIGIRQWFVLSKWSKKYERYKELQRRTDEKLDFDVDNENKKDGQQ